MEDGAKPAEDGSHNHGNPKPQPGSVVVSLWISPERRDKLEKLGADWLNARIDEAVIPRDGEQAAGQTGSLQERISVMQAIGEQIEEIARWADDGDIFIATRKAYEHTREKLLLAEQMMESKKSAQGSDSP